MGWQETSGSEVGSPDLVSVELRRVSEDELALIARYPRLQWWSSWAREIWPGETEPEALGRSYEILLREDDGRDPLLLRAQNTILAMGAATQLVEPASGLALVLPWWRYSTIGPERVAEIAHIAAGIVADERPDFREPHGENDEVPEVVLQIGHAVMQQLPSVNGDLRGRSEWRAGRNTDRK